MKNQPTITVLMPVYNGETYLREAIDSILNQTYTDFEFLIINDGSSDATVSIIQEYTDSRIRLVHNEKNMGLIATLNKGFELARGKYIARMDADDISLPERLEKQIDFMENNPEIGICGTWFDTFDKTGLTGGARYAENHDEICLKHLYQIHLSHGTAIIRKTVIDNLGLRFDPDFAHAEDYELFTRMSSHTRLANLQFVGYKVRHHENEVSKKYNLIQAENSKRIRLREFKKLGLEISPEQLHSYSSLAHHEYLSIKEKPEEIERMLSAMVEANQKSMVFPEPFFMKHISTFWFHYCYKAVNQKTFWSSGLSKNSTLSTVQRVKWFIKSPFS